MCGEGCRGQDPSSDLRGLLTEIQALRGQLEKSIETSSALRSRLEEQLALEGKRAQEAALTVALQTLTVPEWPLHLDKHGTAPALRPETAAPCVCRRDVRAPGCPWPTDVSPRCQQAPDARGARAWPLLSCQLRQSLVISVRGLWVEGSGAWASRVLLASGLAPAPHPSVHSAFARHSTAEHPPSRLLPFKGNLSVLLRLSVSCKDPKSNPGGLKTASVLH